ncbi:hypothetical protein ACUOA8_55610, partial [Escherichia sp. SS-MK2]
PLQADMFSNGGTDGGAVHLTGTGVPTVVMGPATRHGHCAASIADCRDIIKVFRPAGGIKHNGDVRRHRAGGSLPAA